jgi:hypothetical protein
MVHGCAKSRGEEQSIALGEATSDPGRQKAAEKNQPLGTYVRIRSPEKIVIICPTPLEAVNDKSLNFWKVFGTRI